MALVLNLTTRQVSGLMNIYYGKAYRTPHHRHDTGELYYSYHNIGKQELDNLVARGFVEKPCGSLFELTETGKQAAQYYQSVPEYKGFIK